MNSFILLFVIPFVVLLPVYIRAEKQVVVQDDKHGVVQDEKQGGVPALTSSLYLMAAGAVLFALSDLLQGIKLSKPGDWPLYYLNLIVYFCGLLLIALSTSF